MTLLITPEELSRELGSVRVFDCRFSLTDHAAGRRAWLDGHIPGARHLDMEADLAGDKTGRNGRHPLPSRHAFEAALRDAGIDGGDTLVFYDDQRLAGAARAWWLAGYFGIDRVSVLDGGFAAWQAAGLPIERGEPAPLPRGTIELATARTERLANADDVREPDGVTLVDSRERARYLGDDEPIDPVPGRIPGAVNLVWTTATDADGRVHPPQKQRERWAPIDGDDVVLYCGSGVTASVNALSRELAGLTPARLYAGSYSEWCADPGNPIATGDPDGNAIE